MPFMDFGMAADAWLLPAYMADRAERSQSALGFFVCMQCWLVQGDGGVPSRPSAALMPRPDENEAIGLRAFAAKMADRLPLNGRSQVICLGREAAEIAPWMQGVAIPVTVLQEHASLGGAVGTDLICLADQVIVSADPRALLHLVAGALAPDGVAVFDAPSLPELIEDVRIDWLCHGQTVLPSMGLIEQMLEGSGLRLFDAEILAGRDGWLRYHLCRTDARWPRARVLRALIDSEAEARLSDAATYEDFGVRARAAQAGLIDFLHSAHYGRKTVAAYGAGPQAVRVIGAVGPEAREIAYTVDPNPARQGKALPGIGIASFDPDELRRRRPDFVLILQGDARDLIAHELADLRKMGTRFVTALPHVSVMV